MLYTTIKKGVQNYILNAFERGSLLITIDHVLSWYSSTNLKSRLFFQLKEYYHGRF